MMPPQNPFGSDPRARPRPFAFRPPRDNRAVSWLCKQLSPLSLRRSLKVVDVVVPPGDMDRLRALRGRRCLLLPSHSGGYEPTLVVYLSKRLRANFNYLAAQETFDRSPFAAWFMQRLGAYSIVRGTADRPSFQTTRRLLVAGRRWLVIFPEGQTVWQNDTVMPFQPGVVQLAFKACEDLAAAGQAVSLPCLPMAIKYVYLQDMRAARDASMARLEARLLADGGAAAGDAYERLRRIADAVLAANERAHGVATAADDSMDDRIQRMKERVVRRIEERLDVLPRADQNLLDRVRALFNAVDRIVYEEPDASEYERKLHAERQAAVRSLYGDLWRVLQFVAIYGGYVRERLTVERFMDVLCLLEMEVLGERRIWGPRRAVVAVGDPLDLGERLADYTADKRGTTRDVTLELETRVRTMIEDLAARHSHAFEDL